MDIQHKTGVWIMLMAGKEAFAGGKGFHGPAEILKKAAEALTDQIVVVHYGYFRDA
jgi:hypothetical protein